VVADPNFAAMYATRSRNVKADRRDARTLAEAWTRGQSIGASGVGSTAPGAGATRGARSVGPDQDPIHLARRSALATRRPSGQERQRGVLRAADRPSILLPRALRCLLALHQSALPLIYFWRNSYGGRAKAAWILRRPRSGSWSVDLLHRHTPRDMRTGINGLEPGAGRCRCGCRNCCAERNASGRSGLQPFRFWKAMFVRICAFASGHTACFRSLADDPDPWRT
jgi:hypothetical protein